MCSKLLLVICLFNGMTWVFTVSEVIFSVEELNDNSLSCKQTKENPVNATVLENEEMKLSVKFEKPHSKPFPNINYFRCNGKDKNHAFVDHFKKSTSSAVTSIKAIPQMSGRWECEILTNIYTNIPPVKLYLGESYTQLLCYVNVHVRLLETPQTVLVNNMIIPTDRTASTEEDVDHSAVYYYINGDIVTVACIPGNKILNENTDTTSIEFQYNYAENLDNMFKEQKSKRNKLGYGFHTKLQTQHDNSVMICKCHVQDDHTTIQVKFVLNQTITSNGNITVNGLMARPFKILKNDMNSLIVNMNYLFFKDEKVKLVCKSNRNVLRAVGKQNECKSGQPAFEQRLSTPFDYNCFLCDTNGVIHENISVTTKELALYFKDNKRLDVDLPREKILMELFEYNEAERHSWIYYEFEEGEKVKLKCIYTKDQESHAEMIVKYTFDNTEIKESTQVTLTSKYENKLFECRLEAKDSNIAWIYKRIWVLFRKRPLTTTPATTTSSGGMTTPTEPKKTERREFNSTSESPSGLEGLEIPIWAIAVGAVLMCIVLSSVVIAIWKMRKRSIRSESSANNYENLQNQNSQASIPPYPEQWSRKEEQNYHVPIDSRNDSNIYAEPVRGPDDPYAIPIPKSQRPPKGSQYDPGPTYAELNIDSGGKTSFSNIGDPQYSSVKELYTQVVPKNLRPNNKNNYDNVFPDAHYVNSKNPEYVEPTYCQAYKK